MRAKATSLSTSDTIRVIENPAVSRVINDAMRFGCCTGSRSKRSSVKHTVAGQVREHFNIESDTVFVGTEIVKSCRDY